MRVKAAAQDARAITDRATAEGWDMLTDAESQQVAELLEARRLRPAGWCTSRA
ncbi:hypothetical protein Mkiyose1665_59720 [Mycobacterium kiyosense]|uniref:Uncharacterized protein n=1 Tax=Mycobacterium kiyosense TaxID=2871094 RepID=A0AA37Q5P3_9MYCO|nr:hypothetical protein SRL2020028_63680 [Mycobacterium kiyosense]GLB99382.1 hypothetical protein SRL2020226_61580 [Mycobacterium kiyosense]GLD45472.1 hypothetical protein Mkiyose1665_59720 [Mycobacterium kiyosense]